MSDLIDTTPTRVRKWLVNEFDEKYCRTTVTFRNNTGATASFMDGATLKLSAGKYYLADGVTCAAILAEPIYNLANNTDATASVLIRGPAVVNRDDMAFEISSTDPDTDPDVTAQVAALAALSPPIIVVRSSQLTQTQ